MLTDVGQIKISGGCEVFAEGWITFTPLDKERTAVRVDNSGSYFYAEDGDSLPSFEFKVHTEQLSVFINRWIDLMDSVRKEADYFSTRNAAVRFDFSLRDKKIHFSSSENQDGAQLDPIVESIEAFVAACYRKTKSPAPKSSKPMFCSKNKTEAFLAAPDEREKITIRFDDMNGLHGGRIIVVNGAGNALVQIVSFDSEHNQMWEKRYTFDISPAQLNSIYTEIINNDVLTIRLEDRPGDPDETRIHFSISKGNNDSFLLDAWERSSLPPEAHQNSPRARFDRACLAIKRLAHVAKTEKKPVHVGPYISP